MSLELRRRLRRRAGQRGSLIIEMLVMTPLFAALCGFAFWFYQVHSAQMSVYRKVREPVWATATFGCGRAGDTRTSLPGPQENTSIASDLPPVTTADVTPVFQYVPGGPNNDAITRRVDLGRSETTEQLDGKDVPGIMRAPNTTFRTNARMMCNERVENGELDMMKRIAAVAFRK